MLEEIMAEHFTEPTKWNILYILKYKYLFHIKYKKHKYRLKSVWRFNYIKIRVYIYKIKIIIPTMREVGNEVEKKKTQTDSKMKYLIF